MRKLLVCVGIALGTSTLHADAPKPGLTLPAGRINVAVNLEVEATSGQFGKPTSISPDLSYGVTDDLTLSLAHSTFMLTGFRGAAGKGLCITGTDPMATRSCAQVYNNVGAEALYTLTRGELALALNAGIHATNLDAGFYVAKLGAKLRYARGALSFTAMPSVLIALNKRDGMPPNRNKDMLFAPVVAAYKLTPMLGLGFGTGIKGALDGFGNAWEFPLGVIGTVAVSPQLGFGASWIFGKVLGGADDPPAPAPEATGFRYRALQVWASYTH